MIRVLVADDQALVRLGLKVLLESEDDLELVGEAEHGKAAEGLARRERPDDDQLPGVASHLLSQHPTVKVLGLTADGRHGLLYELRPRLTPIREVGPPSSSA